MVIMQGDNIKIDIDEEELIKSIGLLMDMRDYCKEQTEDGVSDTVSALNCALETMLAFASEHFELGGDDDDSRREQNP